jgi:hypothetical protein
MAKLARRSPLKAKPLRLAGQSVQDEIDHWFDDVLNDHLVLLLGGFAVWSTALVTWLFPAPRFTFFVMVSVAFAAMLAWSVPKVVKARRKIQRLRLGRDGERAVAECLDLVRHDGAWVIHDLPGSGFNVDHVVVGTQGVFAVETKTWSKPASGEARIQFDGSKLIVAGTLPSRDPVAQARAQAAWVAKTLEELTGRRYPVRPVVVFPGWFVERAPNPTTRDVWVLEPKELRGWLAREPHVIPPRDVALIHSRLKLVARGGA